MTTTFALLLAATLGAQPSDVGDASSIAQGLIEKGHKRVAVVPVVLTRYSGSDQAATVGPLGPRGKSLTNALRDLLEASSEGGKKYEVVPEQSIVRAMRARGFGPADMKDPMKVRQIGRDAGADALVVVEQEVPSLFGDDRQAEVKLVSETIDTSDGVATNETTLLDDLTLSKAAFQGESWELRRWNGDRLENVGIDLPGLQPFGMGSAWEKAQYASLRPGPVHPHLVPGFPYRVSIEVNGKPRVPQPLYDGPGAPLVVELNAGEVYRIVLDNQSHKPVYCALYIDGANSVDKVVVEPSQLETRRHWFLPPMSGRRHIDGFSTIRCDGSRAFHRFTIATRDEVVQQGASFEPNIGMITAVFYTYGMDGIQLPPESMAPRALPRAAFGTIGGSGGQDRVELVRGRRGLMLAAMTFYYRSSEQVALLLNGKGSQSDPLVHQAAYVPPAIGDNGPPTPMPSPSDGTNKADTSDGAEEYQLEP